MGGPGGDAGARGVLGQPRALAGQPDAFLGQLRQQQRLQLARRRLCVLGRPLPRSQCERGWPRCSNHERGQRHPPRHGQICDGSDDIRLGMWNGGGGVDLSYAFTNPFGFAFAFVDGHCRYYASTDTMTGIATGMLDGTDAASLARDMGYAQIAKFGRGQLRSGLSGCGRIVDSGDGANAFGCSCGCERRCTRQVSPRLKRPRARRSSASRNRARGSPARCGRPWWRATC